MWRLLLPVVLAVIGGIFGWLLGDAAVRPEIFGIGLLAGVVVIMGTLAIYTVPGLPGFSTAAVLYGFAVGFIMGSMGVM